MPPKGKGLLNRFSAFLQSDTLSLTTSGSASPPASPPRNPPTTTTTGNTNSNNTSSQQQQHHHHHDPSNHNHHSFSGKRSPSVATNDCPSPMLGPLESGSNSFASSAAVSLQPRRSEDGTSSGHGGGFYMLDGGGSSSNGAANCGNNNSSNNNADAFKMFSIVGPAFSNAHSGSADDVSGKNNNSSGHQSHGRRSSFVKVGSLIAAPAVPTSSSSSEQQKPPQGSGSNNSDEKHNGNNNNDDDDNNEAGVTPPISAEEKATRKEARLKRLNSFFEKGNVVRVVSTDCSVSPARQRDILDNIAESEHDIDLAIATLKNAYGLDKSEATIVVHGAESKSNSNCNSNQQQIEAAAAATSAAAATVQRRKRSSTVAKADLVTLLGPLLPERTGSDRKTINTGNVHGNRYIAVGPNTPQHAWFFFGGEPAVVNYADRTISFGATATVASANVPPPSDKHCAREQELADATLIELVREELANADASVMKRHSPNSSLSSEMSGRSFGEMVDLEELVRSLQ